MSLNDFHFISKLGEGTYSSVWKVRRHSDNQEYAIKKVKLSGLTEKERLNALNEVRLLASIDSPYVIGFKETFFAEQNMLCVVMEYAGGGDAQGLITKNQRARTLIKEKTIWRYALSMIQGLKVLHEKKIVHRDIKCANVFISKDELTAKLGDLNVSTVAKESMVHTQTGTPYYASPEVWRDEPYDMKSDIWSLGCVLYELCALKPPFRATNMPELFRKVQKGVYEKIPPSYSGDLSTLIALCLQLVPGKRLSADQLLNHPVIQRNCRDILKGERLEAEESPERKNELLSTIRIPKNVKSIRGVENQLPKSKYVPKSVKNVAKSVDDKESMAHHNREKSLLTNKSSLLVGVKSPHANNKNHHSPDPSSYKAAEVDVRGRAKDQMEAPQRKYVKEVLLSEESDNIGVRKMVSPKTGQIKKADKDLEDLERIYKERLASMDRKAEQVINKYHAQQNQPYHLPQGHGHKMASNLINNAKRDLDIYNSEPSKRNDYSGLGIQSPRVDSYASPKLGNGVKRVGDYSYNKDQNEKKQAEHKKRIDDAVEAARMKAQSNNMQLRGVARPVWWG